MTSGGAFVRTFGGSPRLSVVGDVYGFLASGEETAGEYALLEALITSDNGPPPHVHSREDEVFYVWTARSRSA